jgi:hypothetical protein
MTMPVEPPTKSPVANAEKSARPKFDAFHPEMPRIPGVNNAPRTGRGMGARHFAKIGGMIVAVLVIGIAILWWITRAPRNAAKSPASEAAMAESAATLPPFPAPTSPVNQGSTVAATVEELSKPWSAKQFTFVKPFTNESVNAIVIRLPGGGLWAISLQEPYGPCTLEYVTDLGWLAAQSGYRAGHPMIVNPCNETIYDPLKVGPLGGDVWARGEIVQGAGLRPPLSIEVQVRGHSIIADRIE